MTSIRGRGRFCKKRISEGPLESSPPPKSSYDKTPINPPAIEPLIAKYIEEILQKILKTVLKAQAPPSDGSCKKSFKARLPNIYHGKSHIEYYNFYQQYKNHFATAKAKGLNHIFFAAFFLCNRINFRWQQYKWKHKAESSVPITWEEFKTFFYQSLGDSQAFVDSY